MHLSMKLLHMESCKERLSGLIGESMHHHHPFVVNKRGRDGGECIPPRGMASQHRALVTQAYKAYVLRYHYDPHRPSPSSR